jgi:uncharacterized protein
MTAVDTNVLLYAHKRHILFHEAAQRVIRELVERNEPWAIPWPCIHEFYAAASNPRIFPERDAAHGAIEQINIWFEAPNLQMIGETNEHWETLSRVLTESKVVGGATHDARIAAICIENGVRELWTADRDFAKFKGLKSSNPLVS